MKSSILCLAVTAFFSVLPGVSAGPVEVIPPSFRGSSQPQVVVAGDGAVGVTFGKGTNVYFTSSNDRGRNFGEPVLVGSLPKLGLGRRRGPRMVVSDRGYVISAVSHASGNLVTWYSGDAGRKWSVSARVNSVTNSAREGLHAMAGDMAGHVYLSWLDLRNGKTELWMAGSEDGGMTWGENRLVYKSPSGSVCECCHPSLALDGAGRLWAMWRNSIDGARDMYLSSSVDGGRTFTEAAKLGTLSWALKACPMDGGQIVIGEDNLPQTVWQRDRSVVRADVTGERILSLRGVQPVGAIANGTEYWLWQEGRELYLKRGGAGAAVLDKDGAFASIATGRSGARPYAVWESTVNGGKTIVGEELP